jgi:hypothetical protein
VVGFLRITVLYTIHRSCKEKHMIHRKEGSWYKEPYGDVLKELVRAAEDVGAATHGHQFDASAPLHKARVSFLLGVLHALNADKTPPYAPGDRIVANDSRGIRALYNAGPPLEYKVRYSVTESWFIDGRWYVELTLSHRAMIPPLYPAGAFLPLEAEIA